jgi:hypothetical protein
MLRRFIIAFVITVAAVLGYQAYQGQFTTTPMKKASTLMCPVGSKPICKINPIAGPSRNCECQVIG